jgi:phosphinothricin acetyltransferase
MAVLVTSTGAATVRLARRDDAEVIARIYNQAIEERIATFETEPRTIAYIEHMLEERGSQYPTVVAERDGVIVAWATVGRYRERECYRGVGEHSVYVDAHARRQGSGRAALEGLIRECQARGFWKLVSRIFVHNDASRALHLKLGFREVGIYQRHAQLDGAWIDCVIVEKLL